MRGAHKPASNGFAILIEYDRLVKAASMIGVFAVYLVRDMRHPCLRCTRGAWQLSRRDWVVTALETVRHGITIIFCWSGA